MDENQSRRTRETQLLRAAIETFAALSLADKVAKQMIDPTPLLASYNVLATAAKAGVHDPFLSADIAFHRTLVELADVEGLVESWEMVHACQVEFQSDTIRTQWPDLNVLVELHQPIMDSVVAGDTISAKQSVNAHFNPVWYRMAAEGSHIPLQRDPLALALAYLDLHMQQPLQLEKVARQICRISPSHLARLFRQEVGVSYTAYLREIRLKRAAVMLKGADTSIGEIARRVGYLDGSRFAEHFRRHYKVTPSAYRSSETLKKSS